MRCFFVLAVWVATSVLRKIAHRLSRAEIHRDMTGFRAEGFQFYYFHLNSQQLTLPWCGVLLRFNSTFYFFQWKLHLIHSAYRPKS